MARIAQMEQAQRTVVVDRVELVDRLEQNREEHLKDYTEAMHGYKKTLAEKLDDAFDDAFANAKTKLAMIYASTKDRVAKFTDTDIEKQRDTFTFLDSIYVEMKVPRSYVKEYDAAIAMANWDVRETLELTHSEFTCFVRNEWDWSNDFALTSAIYKN